MCVIRGDICLMAFVKAIDDLKTFGGDNRRSYILGLFFTDNGETVPLFIFRAIFADTASHTAASAAASIALNIDNPVGSELAAARIGETDGEERALCEW